MPAGTSRGRTSILSAFHPAEMSGSGPALTGPGDAGACQRGTRLRRPREDSQSVAKGPEAPESTRRSTGGPSSDPAARGRPVVRRLRPGAESREPKAEWSDWSGRRDSDPGPPAPKAGALPGCATPRHLAGRRGLRQLTTEEKTRLTSGPLGDDRIQHPPCRVIDLDESHAHAEAHHAVPHLHEH